MNGFSFADVNNWTTVGDGGSILRTTNGGTTWTSESSGTTDNLYGVSFIDANNGTIVGESGIILRTTNGGTNWTLQSSGTTNQLNGVSFTDANTGTVIGGIAFLDNYVGTILRTTNGGTNWTLQSSGTTSVLYGVFFIDANNGWTVGTNGTILRTTNGGVTFVVEEKDDEAPAEFLLFQNYPNPFNSSTTINYSITQSVLVTLKVYDVLGTELETLVNENKTVGTYDLNWNAAILPSGVYFYRIQAGEFAQTRKMILLK